MESGVTRKIANTARTTNMQRRAEYATSQKNKKNLEPKKLKDIDTVAETISFVIKGQLTPIKHIPITLEKVAKLNVPTDKSNLKSNITVRKPTKVQSRAAKITPNDSPKTVLLKDDTKDNKKNLLKNQIGFSNLEKTIAEVSKVGFDATIKDKDVNSTSQIKRNKPEPKQALVEELSKKDSCDKLKSKLNEKDKTKPQLTQKITEKSPYRAKDTNREQSTEKFPNKIKESTEQKTKCPDVLKESDKSSKLSMPKKPIFKSKLNKEKLLLKAKLLKKSLEIQNKVKTVTKKAARSEKREEKINKTKNKKEIVKEKKEERDEFFNNPKPDEFEFCDKNKSQDKILKEPYKETKDEKKKKVDLKVKQKYLSPSSKKALLKKKLLSKKARLKNKEERRKEKLYKFWNAPKRHRVASLNAIAKVHCLYENESKSLFDKIAEEGMIRRVIKQEVVEKSKKIDKYTDESQSESDSEIEPCTRTLRCVPGLRGVGKHWDPNALSSDENFSDVESVRSIPVKRIRIKKEPKEENEEKKEEKKKKGPPKGKKRVKKPISPPALDLKDLVVSKRMASLNASAMLAASYSNEKKTKFSKRDDTDTDDSSADEYFAALEELEAAKRIKLIEDIKVEKVDKEEDKKLIEVHTTPNKKVAVIVNQDTDVTITGVYVNSTTRSTHHEGYCSIAGMQYRISATSHTQTAATAVATETVLQGTNAAQESQSNEPQRSCSSGQSYAPLDALSNMQPPPGPGIHQQGAPPAQGHHVIHQIGSPQHRQHQAPPQACPSTTFSSSHHGPSYPPPPSEVGSHHSAPPSAPSSSGDSPAGYHHGYYQPAGPLITSPYGHTHAQGPLLQPGPPPPPLSKSASLSDTASTTPSSAPSPMMVPPSQVAPPTASSNGGDSDNEVIITSVTAGTKELPPSTHSAPISYRAYYPPPPATDMRYSYPYPAYHYPTPNPYPPHPHSDLCYPTPTVAYQPKYATYRRYLTTSSQYYQAPPGPTAQEMYAPTQSAPPSNQQQSSQVVTASPSNNNPAYPPGAGTTGPPPPPTIMEPYPPPPAPPTLVETTYQPPPPHHYYTPAYSIPPQCYSHPGRSIPYAHTYQPCPCPMQSCPKNGLTGPLTGEGKRSACISNDSIPLPPVASLALPLEPASATGPPSPARGSAGMPPPPSPAGAVYQATPPAPKQESRSPEVQECGQEKKRKARVGKAMVRSNMQQNTMLLMCNPSQNCNVKREIESPKDKEEIHKKEMPLELKTIPPKMPDPILDKTHITEACSLLKNEIKDDQMTDSAKLSEKVLEDINKNVDTSELVENNNNKHLESNEPTQIVIPEANSHNLPPNTKTVEELLPPCTKTVAENVKVKNMKRKQSMEAAAKEKSIVPDINLPPAAKRRKLNSYKNIIKKKTNCIKINNGKNRLLKPSNAVRRRVSSVKRKLNVSKEQTNNKRIKMCKNPRRNKNINNNNIKTFKSGANSIKTAVKVLDNLIAKNNVDRTIDEVIRTIRISEKSAERTKSSERKTVEEKVVKPAENVGAKPKILETKLATEERSIGKYKNPENKELYKQIGSAKRKSSATRCKEVAKPDLASKVPRRSMHGPKWSNGWRWEGEPFEAKVFVNSDDVTCIRKCYPMMRHDSGDVLAPRDCVLLAGPKKNDLPFVAKIAYLWENPDDGEMMMSLLWYYRPEHTDQGRLPGDEPDEVFASKHKDSNSVACIDDKCYVLTFNEYCRYRKTFRRLEEGTEKKSPCIPLTDPYPRSDRQPVGNVSVENIFFCRKVYDFRQKRIIKNPT